MDAETESTAPTQPDAAGTTCPDAAAAAADKVAGEHSTNGAGCGESQAEMLGNFPPEIATLLVIAGIAGVVLPGPIGTPLLIAGGVVLWPKTFRPIEKWFSRRFPALHREGVIQLKEFVNDLNRRFPEDK